MLMMVRSGCRYVRPERGSWERTKLSLTLIEASPRQAAGNVLPDGRASQHRKDDNFLDIRSLTPQQATGNALAYAVQSFLA
jgi:hypothetical protein